MGYISCFCSFKFPVTGQETHNVRIERSKVQNGGFNLQTTGMSIVEFEKRRQISMVDKQYDTRKTLTKSQVRHLWYRCNIWLVVRSGAYAVFNRQDTGVELWMAVSHAARLQIAIISATIRKQSVLIFTK